MASVIRRLLDICLSTNFAYRFK